MRRAARGFLIVVSILDGFSGLICGVLFVTAPDGRFLQAGALLPVIGTLPFAGFFFRDFTWIGVAMLLVLGIPNLLAAAMLLRRNARQYSAALIAGVLLLVWCGFEMVFMFNLPALGYFTVGAISVVCSSLLPRPSAASA